MARKIGVIGIGNVGSAIAHHIIVQGIADELVLIDQDTAKVEADAMDFTDALANLENHTKIIVNDFSALADADVVFSSIGNIQLANDNQTNDRFAELPYNSAAVREVAPKIKASGFNGVLIVITNPCDVITALYQKYTDLPKNQVIGTGTLLDSARMKRAVAGELKLDPRSVSGYNLGEHGNSQFTAWSTVRALGHSISEIAPQKDISLSTLDQVARDGGFVVLKGKHCTNYGISAAAVHLAKDIIGDAHSELPVSNYRAEYATYLSYPAIIGKNGIEEKIQLDLTEDEKEKLQLSADFIKQKFAETIAQDQS
ncbi:L-2-hydroxyisocaproate dehydrogenase [Ligilactobacillus salitolerans]|uniref:L-2-hydroxyisocaproate dehydrogenase n=1 Tax=Ligilactobacillus salitolerans TaxID=1808352 RepID=A0A401IS83_9LACO|nr:L-lactate dehydrogenase [Ligilactobacillus salitolerans]GBG94376.1 L-2-hydroxyisocaproate dehydrogenase [Ligilactobacillus salitolerans]